MSGRESWSEAEYQNAYADPPDPDDEEDETMAKKKGCDCIDLALDALEKSGTEIVCSYRRLKRGRGTELYAVPLVATQKILGSKVRKPVLLVATFCPFCGKKFPES